MNALHNESFAMPSPRLLFGALAVVAALVLSSPASTHAASVIETQTHSGGLAIPDNGYAGALGDGSYATGTVAESSITIGPGIDDVITDLNITVAMSHTYVGDLTLKLRGPDGTTVFLVNRPGLSFNSDDGITGGGYGADLSVDYPITFDDDAASAIPSEMMGDDHLDDDIIGSIAGTDTYIPSSNLLDTDTLASFNGKSIVGTWTLIAGDSTPQELGALHSWQLSASTIASAPMPGAATAGLALMSAIAGIGVLRRDRRRAA